MKKISLIIVFSLLSAIFIIYSCKKDEPTNLAQNEAADNEDLQISNQIRKFRSDVKNNLKSGNMMDANDAFKLIESTINYTYSWADFEYDDQIVDTILIDITITDNQISFTEAANIYNTIIEGLRSKYEQIDANEKQFILADLYMDENSETSVLIVETSFGTKDNLKTALSVDPDDDYWYWGQDNGKCETGVTEGEIKDAGDVIRREANDILHNSLGGGYFWDNITSKNLYPTNYPAPAGSGYNYLMFYGNYNGNWMWRPDPCLAPVDISFYVDGYVQIVEGYENSLSKQFAHIYTYYENQELINHVSWQETNKRHESRVQLGIKRKKDPKDPVPMNLFE